MKFKAVKIISLLVAVLGASQMTLAEEMPDKTETAKQKELRLEAELNHLFKTSMKTAAYRLDKEGQMKPFATILKSDGSTGVFEVTPKEGEKELSVNEQNLSVRKLLIELAATQQIKGSVSAMYSLVREKGKEERQGIVFEIEHVEGVSLLRFIPLTIKENPLDKTKPRLVLELKSMSTTVKPAVVFAQSIVQ